MSDKYSTVVEIYKKNLTAKNYADNTISSYICYIEKFLFEMDKNPYHLTTKELIDYLLNYNYSSISQQNQIISSIKLFYKYILDKRDIHLDKIERPRKNKTLPRIIDSELIIPKLNNIKNLKHKAILSLAYATGMRVSEVCNLKIKNIDSKRMLILIENGKFNKDRYVPFSENILKLLRKYWIQYKTKEYLFAGQNKLIYSTGSCEKIYKKYIDKYSSFHTLRHSYATYLLEHETDIRIIQKILGHSKITTTEIYTHVSTKLLKNINIPI